jgi:hypothetical protein
VTILLLAVDSRLAAKPTLEGVWVLTFIPGLPDYYGLGFPLDAPVGNGHRLVDYYNVVPRLDDASRFVKDALRIMSQDGLAPQYRVVLDRQAIRNAINTVGGITVNSEMLDGATVLQRYASLPDGDIAAQLQFQADVLLAFSEAVQQRAWTTDQLQALSDQCQHCSPDADILLALARDAIQIGPPQFHVRIYTPNP